MSQLAAAELCLVLRELGVAARPQRRPPAVRFEDGTHLEVIEAEVSTPATVARLRASDPSTTVLVTSLLRPPHRDTLATAGVGWLDRRGHLHLPTLGIDHQVPDLSAPIPAVPDVWQRASVVAVALVLLQRAGPAPTIHDLGFYAGINRNAAVQALEDLRGLGLIDDQDAPRRDALLEQLTVRWHTHWFGLRDRPDVQDLDAEERLVLGVDDDPRRPGWASLDHEDDPTTTRRPPRLLVPDRRALVWMRHKWGASDGTEAATLVAAAPNPVAAADRRTGPAGWPLAHPVILELERRAPGTLATATGRGPATSSGTAAGRDGYRTKVSPASS